MRLITARSSLAPHNICMYRRDVKTDVAISVFDGIKKSAPLQVFLTPETNQVYESSHPIVTHIHI